MRSAEPVRPRCLQWCKTSVNLLSSPPSAGGAVTVLPVLTTAVSLGLMFAILWRLVLPLSRSALATVSIYDALQVWNGFLLPLVLTQSEDKRVLPLALTTFQGQFSINVPATLAAVVLSAIPLLVLYLLARRQLVAGLTMGAGK